MQLLRFQMAVFFKNPAERPDLLSGNMPKELLELFDLIPVVNPIPQIPQGFANINIPDIPVVTLQSSQQGYQGTISKGRADFYYNYVGQKEYGEILKEVAQYAKRFMEFLYSKQQVNRVGCVVNAFFPEENPVKTIAKKYANSDSHRPNISSVISGYKQPSKSAQSIEITGFIEKSKPSQIIFLYTLLPLTA